MDLFGLLVFITAFLKTCEMALQCKTTYSVYGKYLKDHVMSTVGAAGPGDCTHNCDVYPKCKSWNYRLDNKACELNNADRYTHPQDYQDRQSHIYCDSSEPLKGVSDVTQSLLLLCIELVRL